MSDQAQQQWSAILAGGEAHVVPDADLVAHEASAGCPCTPSLEPAEPGDTGPLYQHHSLDRREAGELDDLRSAAA